MKKTSLILSLATLIILAGCSNPNLQPSDEIRDESNETTNVVETNTIETNDSKDYETTNENEMNENDDEDDKTDDNTTVKEVVSPSKTATTSSTTITTTTTSTSYTLAQVAAHASETDCWTVINGNVYDITSYVPKHPGGVQQIMRVCGTDGTQAFVRKHDGDTRPKDVLVDFKI